MLERYTIKKSLRVVILDKSCYNCAPCSEKTPYWDNQFVFLNIRFNRFPILIESNIFIKVNVL